MPQKDHPQLTKPGDAEIIEKLQNAIEYSSKSTGETHCYFILEGGFLKEYHVVDNQEVIRRLTAESEKEKFEKWKEKVLTISQGVTIVVNGIIKTLKGSQ